MLSLREGEGGWANDGSLIVRSAILIVRSIFDYFHLPPGGEFEFFFN